jgi:hypothetical protein
MWKLRKPDINDAIFDIDKVINNCQDLDNIDQQSIATLYEAYDSGNGCVTDSQLDMIGKDKTEALQKQYRKTYNGECLHYIRENLFDGIDKCLYCSIGMPDQLDHYMPMSKYPALGVCRLNLVPLCATCNNRKNDDSYKKYVHPYYQQFPNEVFFIANVTVQNDRISVVLELSADAINDPTLLQRLKNHMDVLLLNKRINRAMNDFLMSFLQQTFVDNNHLETFLDDRLRVYEITYGKNDWRTATIRGLKDCEQFNYMVANNHVRSARINNGVGA